MEANKIIITGGATRIGAAIAKKLSGPNKEILIHYNKSKSKAESLRKELEIVLNPKVKQYSLNNKIYPKGRSTMGLPGTRAQKGKKKWKQIK